MELTVADICAVRERGGGGEQRPCFIAASESDTWNDKSSD